MIHWAVFLDPTYWWMTVVFDVVTTSTFISRICLHLSKVSSTNYEESVIIPNVDVVIAFANKPPPGPTDS